MAIKGVSLAESQEFILSSDAGHPDNITKEVERRIKVEARGGKVEAVRRTEIETEVRNDPAFKPTIFKIGNITKADKVRLGDLTASPTMHGNSVTMTSRRTEKAYETVQRGLTGWENFSDARGNPIPFERSTASLSGNFVTVVSEESMNQLPVSAVYEIAEEILRVNGMTDAMVGNSVVPLQQSEEQPSEAGPATDVPISKNEKEDAPA